ncbi:hypothetical protein, partial [Aeromonas veronii]|uniref:hypothetical protein n=1 Tax=Aeromonas veronii TaxID=654 RepID=UPI003BA01FA4
GDGVKRCAHDADLKRMVVIRSPSPQLVPFKLYRFGKQRPKNYTASMAEPNNISDQARLGCTNSR